MATKKVWEFLRTDNIDGLSDKEIAELYLKAVMERMRFMVHEAMYPNLALDGPKLPPSEADHQRTSDLMTFMEGGRSPDAYSESVLHLAAVYLGYESPKKLLVDFRTMKSSAEANNPLPQIIRNKLRLVPPGGLVTIETPKSSSTFEITSEKSATA